MNRSTVIRLIPAGIALAALTALAAILKRGHVPDREGESTMSRPADERPKNYGEEGQAHSASWGYTGDTGPAHWGDLAPEFAVCKNGGSQSPIDLTDAPEVKPHELEFRYAPVPLEIVNNGHTIQVNYSSGSTLIAGGKEYKLLQFHFHRLSEHTVSGQPADMELHFVHQDAAGGLAVVGVLLNSGRHNQALEQVWAHMPTETDDKQIVAGTTINAADLLPANLSYFSYVGSLTTPPCSEDVRWFVLRNVVELSPAQLDRFAALYPDNARPVQPLNGRAVSYSQASE